MHAAPTPPHRSRLLVTATVLVLVACAGCLAWVASPGSGDETQAASQATGVPQDTPTTTEALSGSRACEREAIQAIVRLVTAHPSSSYEGTMQLAQERERISPQAYTAVVYVLNPVMTEFAQAGGTGLGQIITAHMQPIRRACASG